MNDTFILTDTKENLEASSPGRSWVTVTMEVDENNVLIVAVKDNQSGTELISGQKISQ